MNGKLTVNNVSQWILGIMNIIVIALLGVMLNLPMKNMERIKVVSKNVSALEERIGVLNERQASLDKQLTRIENELQTLRNNDMKEINRKIDDIYKILITLTKQNGRR